MSRRADRANSPPGCSASNPPLVHVHLRPRLPWATTNRPPTAHFPARPAPARSWSARALHRTVTAAAGAVHRTELRVDSPATAGRPELFDSRGGLHRCPRAQAGLVVRRPTGNLFRRNSATWEPPCRSSCAQAPRGKTIAAPQTLIPGPAGQYVRIVAATHQPLEKLVGEGCLRSGLHLRLLHRRSSVPPLARAGRRSSLLVWVLPGLAQRKCYRKGRASAFSPTPNGLCGSTQCRRGHKCARNCRNAEQATLLGRRPG